MKLVDCSTRLAFALAASLAAVTWSGEALAGWVPGDSLIICENDRSYVLRARAVTRDGDVVTGHIIAGSRRSYHVRLIPMGAGYRYAGRGIWLDGIRGQAVLNFGKHHSVACTVSPAA